jgi:hypothetical protein
VNAELPASTVFGRIDLHCRPCLAASGLFSGHVGEGGISADTPLGIDYDGAVQWCLSADMPVRGTNRASPDWGKRRQPIRNGWLRHAGSAMLT